jgi:hypothetical protein
MCEERAAGFRVVAFADLGPLPVTQPGDALPEDLLAVFNSAKAMQMTYGGNVDAWEIGGEPDVGYCTDLPDRYAAYEKAVYLGIKAGEQTRKTVGSGQKAEDRGQRSDGSGQQLGIADGRSQPTAHRPLILMGALALPPGPWLERAARNGLLDYTDAYNFHFYGDAADLKGVIRAHQAFAAQWVDLHNRTVIERDPQGDWIAVSAPAAPNPSSGTAHSPSPLAPNPSPTAPGSWPLAAALLPLWITECGMNAVVPGDFLNPERRQLQTEFTVSTARQALAAENVAVFMPFILVGKGIPQALTLSPDQPLPAWTAYAGFTTRHPFPSRVLALPPRDPNPVVVQWLPDNRTTIPHKVAGTYRFAGSQSIRGVLRIYNFSDKPVSGKLEAGVPGDAPVGASSLANSQENRLQAPPRRRGQAGSYIRLESRDLRPAKSPGTKGLGFPAFESSELTVPPMGRIEISVTFAPESSGYFREYWQAAFVDENGRRSPVYFGLEAVPQEEDFAVVPIQLGPPENSRIRHPMFDDLSVTSESGSWTGINGLVVQSAKGEARPSSLQGSYDATRPAAGAAGEEGGGQKAVVLDASVKAVNDDPLRPTMAIARVHSLPPRGFLRLQLDRPMDPSFKVRVDLVDKHGQRFTIWENFGASYWGPRNDVWLSFEDFHVYFWSRCTDHPDFHPQDIDELQLRFYFAKANDPRTVRLSLLEPK